MTGEGHQDQFPPLKLSDRYRWREPTLAGTLCDGSVAPTPVGRL
jgi:hypothetical protein